jgi:hypothetical protein
MIFARSGPFIFYNLEALRVLKPNVFKPLYDSRILGVVPRVKMRAKHKKDRIMVRCMIREMIVSNSRERAEPRCTNTKSV